MVENWLTPNEFFYVRNHMPVPTVDPHKYVLEVEVPGGKVHRFSLSDIKVGAARGEGGAGLALMCPFHVGALQSPQRRRDHPVCWQSPKRDDRRSQRSRRQVGQWRHLQR